MNTNDIITALEFLSSKKSIAIEVPINGKSRELGDVCAVLANILRELEQHEDARAIIDGMLAEWN